MTFKSNDRYSRPSAKLFLEQLEDRYVPSTNVYEVNTLVDNNNGTAPQPGVQADWIGSLRYCINALNS